MPPIWEQFYDAFFTDNRWMSYLDGLVKTLEISLLAVLIGVVIGVIVAIIRVNKSKNFFIWLLKKFCGLYINVIRGTPAILQLMILYNLVFTGRDTIEVVVGGVCFGINSGAYVAEIVRAGIESIDRGQMEAGRSLGLSQLQTMRLIILPQAIKNILPALCNEFIVLIKETSVASVIAVNELTKVAQYIGSRTYLPLPPLIISACFYMVLTLSLTKLVRTFERRLAASDRH